MYNDVVCVLSRLTFFMAIGSVSEKPILEGKIIIAKILVIGKG